MSTALVLENLRNPALLFFILGLIAVRVKSTLTIPETSAKFISLYLLFSIGFKGGQELSHSTFSQEMALTILFGLASAVFIPMLLFPLLKRKFDLATSAATAAAYGSVSAVTFVTAVAFLEMKGIAYGGHMVALMAMMEAPAIIVGLTLFKFAHKSDELSSVNPQSISELFVHSLTNGSVFLLLGSTVIGWFTSETHAQGIAPFTTDIFKGFLVLFLLDMGLQSGKHLQGFLKNGIFSMLIAIIVPLFIGSSVALVSGIFMSSVGDRLLLTLLTASASYIAVPAAMKNALPTANPGIYTPMALGITFPINIVIGIPIYFLLIEQWS